MKLASGVVDEYIYIVALDATDYITRKTGLSSFTVYRSRNGGAATAYTTPTVTEVDATNMPGVYKFLVDEDTTLDAGDDTQEICLHFTATGMAPVTRAIELYRPKITEGETLTVSSSVASANAVQISGDSTAADNAESFFDGVGYGEILQRTTIATLSSQTSFTLTAGSADNDAYNNCIIVIQDASTAAQKAVGTISDYTGASKTVTLSADPAVFTMAATDIVTILAATAGGGGATAQQVWEYATRTLTALDEDSTTIDIDNSVWGGGTRVLTAATNITSTGAAIPITAGGLVSSDVTAISTDTAAADNAEAMFDGTGYAGGTIKLGVDVVAISDDATAADRFETMLDGTGGNTLYVTAIEGDISGNVVGNVQGHLEGTIGGLSVGALSDFFLIDSGTTFASAVAGSVVKEIADNAGGSSLTVQDIVDGVFDEAVGAHTGLIATALPAIKAKTDSLTFTVANVLDSNALRLGGSTQSLADLKDFADDGYDPSTNKVAGVVLTDTVTTYTGNTPQTGDTYALANGVAGFVAIKADTAAILTDTGTTLDAKVDAIKAKTDSLTFTNAGEVDANAKSMNDETINGTGVSGDLWRGA